MNNDLLNGADRTFGLNDPSLAVGLNDVAFYSTELPFINLIKQGGDRHNNDGAWTLNVTNPDGSTTTLDYSEAWHAGYLDENGYVGNLPEGSSANIFFLNSVSAEAQTGGRYVFHYEGEGDFTIPGAVIIEEESSPGRLVLELVDGTPFGISINSVNADNNLRDFALVREEHEGLYEAGAIFNPDFIALFEDHRTLRFMDWMETNHSNTIEFADLATVDSAFYGIPANQSYEYVFAYQIEELTPETIAGLSRGAFTPIYVDPQTGEPFRDPTTNEVLTRVPNDLLPDGIPAGVPLEIMVALANQVGADPWFNIPHQASDDFIRQFAEYVRDNLDPGLVAHFEYTNEAWNGQFEQYSYLNDSGRAEFGDEFGDFPVHVYYGYKAVQVQEIIRDVFGEEADARTHGVLATQTFNFGVTDQAIVGIERYFEDNNIDANVSDYFDSLSVTGYFGPTVGVGTEDFPGVVEVYRSWIAESKELFANGETSSVYEHFINQAIIDLRDGSLTEAFFADDIANGTIVDAPLAFSILDLIDAFSSNKSRADAYGLDLTQYEGGSHIVAEAGLFGDTELLDFINALNNSDAIVEIYEESARVFREEGGSLLNDFVGVSQQTQFGSFGSLQNLNDQTAVFDFYTDYNLTAPQEYGSINSGRDLSAFQQGTNVIGTAQNDTLHGSLKRDFLAGGDGDDVLVGGAGDDGISGGAGTDRIVVSGVRSDYELVSEGDGFRLTGIDGSDFIVDVEIVSFQDDEAILATTFAAGASEHVRYHGGATYIAVSEISNVGFTLSAITAGSATAGDLGISVTGQGSAVDKVYFNAIGIVDEQRRQIIESGVENAEGQADFFGNASAIQGSAFNDLFDGYDVAESVNLGLGNDSLFGRGGDDTLIGGNGDDTIDGGSGDDLLDGGFGNDSLLGGEGVDTITLNSIRSDYSITVSGNGYLLVGVEGTDYLENIEIARFSDGQAIFIADWIAGANDRVQYFGGDEYDPIVGEFSGVVIARIDSETITGDELGIVPNEVRPTSQVVYYVAARDNAQATYGAIHDFGVANADNVADLVSNVGGFLGTDFTDFFDGSEAGENVDLGGGDDRINGFGGDDSLDGGSGNDVITGGDGNDTLIGGSGDDILVGGSGEDLIVLSGLNTDYTISETTLGYEINGIEGADTLIDVERVQFGDGQISLLSHWVNNASPSAQTFQGGDYIAPNGSSSGVTIGALDVGTETATDLGVPISGYTNFSDTVFFVASRDNINATYENIHNGAATAFTVADLITDVGRIIGSIYNDTFEGSVGDEIVDGNGGDDRLEGFEGNDTLSGNSGDDFISGGVGDDLLEGGSGADVINGGADIDTATYISSTGSISLNFATGIHGGDAAGDIFFGIERLEGTQFGDNVTLGSAQYSVFAGSGNDEIVGGSANNVLFGENGNDTLTGNSGSNLLDGGTGFDSLYGGSESDTLLGGDNADNLFGGSGDDELFGQHGFDRIFAGEGDDLLDGGLNDDALFGELGNDTIFGGAGNDRIFGNAGLDQLFGGDGDDALAGNFNRDTIEGGAGNDTINGGQGNDLADGGDGDDTVWGGEGNDTLLGSEGNDLLIGFSGFDVLVGGEGNDTLEGRFNADQFVFGDNFGQDVITDFAADNQFEKINLAAVTNITDFQDLVTNHLFVDTEGLVTIVDGESVITLLNVNIIDLDETDFIF